jgi:hypothetical protein
MLAPAPKESLEQPPSRAIAASRRLLLDRLAHLPAAQYATMPGWNIAPAPKEESDVAYASSVSEMRLKLSIPPTQSVPTAPRALSLDTCSFALHSSVNIRPH